MLAAGTHGQSKAAFRPYVVMIVDDHAHFRSALRNWIAGLHAGYELVEAGSGEEAVALAGSREIHAALMDIELPGMNGTEATRRIREMLPQVATAIDRHLNTRIGALHMLAASPLADDASRRKELYREAQGFHQSFGSHVILADLEITENLIMEDLEHNIAKLEAVRDLGVNIVIDDFGTGYSSSNYLAKLPVTALKIDRSFIIEMTEGPQGLAIVSTVINLAHTLKLKVVAEGVETEERSKLLKLLSFDEMQGYLFSKPIPAEQLEALLARNPPSPAAP
jgi:EAL domain-containing protein (putative c-di-GMP-specific phosphodiesterase class I)